MPDDPQVLSLFVLAAGHGRTDVPAEERSSIELRTAAVGDVGPGFKTHCRRVTAVKKAYTEIESVAPAFPKSPSHLGTQSATRSSCLSEGDPA